MPKKKSKKKKRNGGSIIILTKATVEQAMTNFQEDMMKDPEGKRILEEQEKALELALKEAV
jgi:ubiquinone biosynthesis protein Coq4